MTIANMGWDWLPAKDKLYYTDDAVAIYHADCREILPLIPDKSIDLVLTDPPYNENYNYRGSDFTDYRNDYYVWLEHLLIDSKRLLKGIGSIYWKHSSRQIDKMLPLLNKHFTFRNLIIWVSNSQAHPQDNYDSYYEPIYYFTKSDDYTFNKRSELRKMPKDYWSGEGKEFVGLLVNCWYDIPKIQAGCLTPEGIHSGKEKSHPSSMPTRLAERIINVSSNRDNMILDLFLGSGTTALASKILGRKCIGIEIEEKYCEIAKKRLSQSVMRLEE